MLYSVPGTNFLTYDLRVAELKLICYSHFIEVNRDGFIKQKEKRQVFRLLETGIA